MSNSRALTVGLLWHSVNSDNLGVGALTASQIVLLEEAADSAGVDIRFKVLGWRDPEPPYISGPNIEFVAMKGRDYIRPGGLFSQVRSCDFVLDISAGDSFADIYGTKRFLFNFLSKLNVLIARRALVLSPQTIGPFQRWWTRRLAVLAIARATKVVTRDRLSSDYLRELGLDRDFIEATDVAIRLPFETPDIRKEGPVKVGLNVSGLLFNGGYNQSNMFSLSSDYQELTRSLCRYFLNLPDTELHLVGHVNSHSQPVEDDYRIAELLKKEFPDAVLAPRFDHPSSAKSYIAALDFFAGSRMHACIAAFSSGVPVLPMAYSRKFAGLFGTLGYNHLADCKAESSEEIVATVTKAFAERAQLKADLEIALQEAQRKLQNYQHVLRELLEKTKVAP